MTTAFSELTDKNRSETFASPTADVVIRPGYNLVNADSTTEGSRLVLTKYIPEQLMTKYVRAAMKRASVQPLEGKWFSEIAGLNGVWANSDDLKSCVAELEEVLIDWLLLKIEHGDHDIPILDDISLNAII